MAVSTHRDPDEILSGLIAWLDARGEIGRPELAGYERPPVGFSTETILVDVRRTRADETEDERLVLKLPPSGPGIFPTYDFTLQARVQEAAAAAGIPTPVPVQVEHDTRWTGAAFLVMPAIAGHIIGAVPLTDPWLTKAGPDIGATVHACYLDIIADINRIDWRASGLVDVVPQRDNQAEITHWRDYLAWYGDGTVLVPQLVEALDWCEDHRPVTAAEPSLLWGDVRLGNVIFADERTPVAVLDWEMATIGSAEHDLAWALTLQAVQDEFLGQPAPGFLDHDTAVGRYETRLGRSVEHLDWYEIFALIRSTAIMTRIAHLRELAGESGGTPVTDNPLLTILERRIAAADSV